MGLEGTVPDSQTGLEIELVPTRQKGKFIGESWGIGLNIKEGLISLVREN